MTYVIFHDFPRLENGLTKFHNFRELQTALQTECNTAMDWESVSAQTQTN